MTCARVRVPFPMSDFEGSNPIHTWGPSRCGFAIYRVLGRT